MRKAVGRWQILFDGESKGLFKKGGDKNSAKYTTKLKCEKMSLCEA